MARAVTVSSSRGWPSARHLSLKGIQEFTFAVQTTKRRLVFLPSGVDLHPTAGVGTGSDSSQANPLLVGAPVSWLGYAPTDVLRCRHWCCRLR